MKRKNYLICLLTAIILLPIGVQAKDKKKGKKNIPMTEIQTIKIRDLLFMESTDLRLELIT